MKILRLKELFKRAGPYLALALIVPGGTLFALFYWLSQHWHSEA